MNLNRLGISIIEVFIKREGTMISQGSTREVGLSKGVDQTISMGMEETIGVKTIIISSTEEWSCN